MKCSQEKCSEPASWTYVWPGKPERSYACPDDFLRAVGIARTMGFQLGDARVMTPEEMTATTAPAKETP